MNTITDVILQVLPNIQIGIETAQRTRLGSALSAVNDMHLAVFWLQAAEKELAIAQGDEEAVATAQVTSKQLFTLPTFLGTNDRLDHLSTTLNFLNQKLEAFKEEIAGPYHVKYKVDRGYDKLMDAEFNTNLAKQYYDELNRQ